MGPGRQRSVKTQPTEKKKISKWPWGAGLSHSARAWPGSAKKGGKPSLLCPTDKIRQQKINALSSRSKSNKSWEPAGGGGGGAAQFVAEKEEPRISRES